MSNRQPTKGLCNHLSEIYTLLLIRSFYRNQQDFDQKSTKDIDIMDKKTARRFLNEMKNHVWIIEKQNPDGMWYPTLKLFGKGVYATRKIAREEKWIMSIARRNIKYRVVKYEAVK